MKLQELLKNIEPIQIVGDADVEKCLRMLTFLPMDEVRRLASLEGQEINKAKEILADVMTMEDGDDIRNYLQKILG